jgi:hypothetical protein
MIVIIGDDDDYANFSSDSKSNQALTLRTLAYCLTAKLLLALASIMILGSESRGIHDHILLSDGSGNLQKEV